mmetsp:Transcript_95722/g.166258  ORF Transcript_95722/g.166258 Transcript_95722/m.166258 type:complete len:341 (-) Transcript_95722:57-1079(-)
MIMGHGHVLTCLLLSLAGLHTSSALHLEDQCPTYPAKPGQHEMYGCNEGIDGPQWSSGDSTCSGSFQAHHSSNPFVNDKLSLNWHLGNPSRGNPSKDTQLSIVDLQAMANDWAQQRLEFDTVSYVASGVNFSHLLSRSFFKPLAPMMNAVSNATAPLHHHTIQFKVKSPFQLSCNSAAKSRLAMCNNTQALQYLWLHQQADGIFGKVSNRPLTVHVHAANSKTLVGDFGPDWFPMWLHTYLEAHRDHQWTFHSSNCQHFAYNTMVDLGETCRAAKKEQCPPTDLLAVLPFQTYIGMNSVVFFACAFCAMAVTAYATIRISYRLLRGARRASASTLSKPLL